MIVMENDYWILQNELQKIKEKKDFKIHGLVGEEDLLSFKKDSLDLIVCNNNLNYVNDLPFMIS